MKKRIFSMLSILVIALAAFAEGRAKYVFYFIGDGMGVNQVNAAETYLGALEGRIGIQDLSTQKIMNKQGKMVISNASAEVKEIFDVTGFSDILTIE